jgi:hypothetical protein
MLPNGLGPEPLERPARVRRRDARDSVAALEAFAGPRWQEAVIEPEEEHMPAQVFCDHYETTETGAMMANRPIR